MTNLQSAQHAAETSLRTYEQLGRELPENMATWTPAQRQQMRAARNAYYAALSALNALRGSDAS